MCEIGDHRIDPRSQIEHHRPNFSHYYCRFFERQTLFKSQMSIAFCDNCDVKKSTHQCKDCYTNLCEECSALHPKVKATRGHAVEPKDIEFVVPPVNSELLETSDPKVNTIPTLVRYNTNPGHWSRLLSATGMAKEQILLATMALLRINAMTTAIKATVKRTLTNQLMTRGSTRLVTK